METVCEDETNCTVAEAETEELTPNDLLKPCTGRHSSLTPTAIDVVQADKVASFIAMEGPMISSHEEYTELATKSGRDNEAGEAAIESSIPGCVDEKADASTSNRSPAPEVASPRKYQTVVNSNNVVTSQPRSHLSDVPRAFTLDMFDDVSSEVFSTMTRLHRSHPFLENVIKETACEMYNDTASQFFKDLNSIPYEDMLTKLVTKGETLVANNAYIYYKGVSFRDPDGSSLSGKGSMTQGRAYLTNKRLLLLSAEEASVCSLEGELLDQQTGKPQNYKLSTFVGDTLHFQSIPLEGILGIELHTTSGIKSQSRLTGYKPCCSQFWESICCCFKSCSRRCCRMSCCKKVWEAQHVSRSAHANRYMTIGTLLPPWDLKTMVRIYIDNSVQLSAMTSFVSDMQEHASNLIQRNYHLTIDGYTGK